jgi:hypothetical protein
MPLKRVCSSADRTGVVIRSPGRLAVLLGLMLPVAAFCQSSTDLWRFAHPNAQAVISVNWQRIRQSPAVTILRDKWLTASAAQAIPGIELLDDIDRVVISSPGAPQGDSAEAPMLIAMHGHFDPAVMRHFFAKLGAKAQAYNSYQVYRPQGKDAKDNAYVLFDQNTLLFGDASSIFASLQRNQFPPAAPEPGSLVARAAESEDTYDFWLSMKTPDVLSGDRLEDLFRGSSLASDSQGLEVGLTLRSGLAADIAMYFGSEASAKRVVAEMVRFIAEVSKDKNTDPEFRQIERKLKIASDGSLAKISLHLSPDDLEKSARVVAKSYAAGFMAARAASDVAPVPRPAAGPAPVPPKRAMIRIEGLDDGPREIPYDWQ